MSPDAVPPSTPGEGLSVTALGGRQPGTVTAVVVGEVDHGTSSEPDGCLRDLLGRRPAALVVDLTAVRFPNAGGLRVLEAARRLAVREGTTFLLHCGTNRSVLRPLEVCGLRTVMDLVDRSVPEPRDPGDPTYVS